ncbi:MAG: hypothetical protein KJO17_09655 [Acidimicrobiia bacterium]|nr:hypothetical protein [Acidimicrobiia bacterium]
MSAPVEAGRRTASGFAVMTLVRHAAVVGLAGVGTGILVGGLGGRVAMRISAIVAPDYVAGALTEGGNRVGDITIGGTLALVIFVGIFGGALGAVAYVIVEPWLAVAGRWRDAAFAVIITAVAAPGTLTADNSDFFILRHQEINVAMFFGLFVAFGLLLPRAVRLADRKLPLIDPGRPVASGVGYLAVALVGLQFVVAFFAQFFVDGTTDGPPNVPVGLVLGALAAVTIAVHGRRLQSRTTDWLIRVGSGLLIIAVALGSVRTGQSVIEILEL